MKSNNDHNAARQILEIIPCVMRVMASEFRHSNPLVMPAHFRLLGMLSHHFWTLTELADHTSVSLPTMSSTITTLEKRGWVKRVRSEEDRRIVVIQVTLEGRRVLEDVYHRAEIRIAALLKPLDSANQEVLMRGLDVLSQVFEPGIPDGTDKDPSPELCKLGH